MTVPTVPALHNSLANGLQNVKSKLNLDRGTHEELTSHARTHTHTFNSPLSWTTQVSR